MRISEWSSDVCPSASGRARPARFRHASRDRPACPAVRPAGLPMRVGFYAPLEPPDQPAPSGDRRIARLLMQAMTGMGHEVFVLSTLRSYNRDGDAALERQTAAAAAAEAGRIAAAWETGAAPKADLLFTYHVYHKAAAYLGQIGRASGRERVCQDVKI